MAEYTALAPLFTDIANAIRSKTGETGQITANSFPSSITNIKTSNIKIIQVSTSANVESQSVYTFTFPVEFAPTGFIGCAADIVINSYSPVYEMVSPNRYVTSFSYIDNKFISVTTYVYASTGGTSTSRAYVDMTLGTNYDLNRYTLKSFNVTISSTQVSIVNSSSNADKKFFIQGNNSKGYWNVVYWA